MPTISEHDALPTGARLGEFEIQQVLGIGGFGIVYLAFDHALERQVAIKEYMPAALAGRGEGSQVVVRSASHAETFTLGLRSFINEARLLARFDHASLVKVYRFWEQHGTAYMVMPFYRGRTLQQVRRDMSGPPDEAWLRRLIMPLLGALECLHRENVFHRDVAPDNILLLDDETGPGMGQPVLLDLGAARRVIGDHTQTLTAIVKPSFAPIEQYAETVQLRQGPWTDLYALAAVVHFCITGRPPVPATVRTVQDDLATMRQMSASLATGFDCHFSESFIDAIDHALLVRPQDRPESVAAWRAELSGIVGKQQVSGGADVAVPADSKSAEWVAQTVLVKPAGTEDTPPGHKAIEAASFMTTIPAASRLHAPPAWPARPAQPMPPVPGSASRPDHVPMPHASMALAPGQSVPAASASASDNTIPVTMPIGRPAGTEQASAASAVSASESVATSMPSRIWLRWVFLVLGLCMVTAVWWSRHQTPKRAPVVPDEVVGLTQARDMDLKRSSASQARAERGSAEQGNNKAQASSSPAPKPRRQPKQQETTTQKDEASTSDASGALNPRKACGNRVFIWMAICMKRYCAKPDYAAHPECQHMREQEAAQNNVTPP